MPSQYVWLDFPIYIPFRGKQKAFRGYTYDDKGLLLMWWHEAGYISRFILFSDVSGKEVDCSSRFREDEQTAVDMQGLCDSVFLHLRCMGANVEQGLPTLRELYPLLEQELADKLRTLNVICS